MGRVASRSLRWTSSSFDHASAASSSFTWSARSVSVALTLGCHPGPELLGGLLDQRRGVLGGFEQQPVLPDGIGGLGNLVQLLDARAAVQQAAQPFPGRQPLLGELAQSLPVARLLAQGRLLPDRD